jgi:hypothetical protein
VSWSQQIRKDQLNFRLRLAETAETPEIAFQHKPIADAYSANQKRLAGAVHDLRSARVHELRLRGGGSQQKQQGAKNHQASNKHEVFFLIDIDIDIDIDIFIDICIGTTIAPKRIVLQYYY